MAPYTDGRQLAGRFEEDPATPMTPFSFREQEQSLLGRNSRVDGDSDSDSNNDNFRGDPEKVVSITAFTTNAPPCSPRKIVGFFILVLLVSTIVFSQLLIRVPEDADEQSGHPADMKPVLPVNPIPPSEPSDPSPPSPPSLPTESLPPVPPASDEMIDPALVASPAPQDYLLSPDWDFDAPPTVREFFWTVKDTERNPDGVYRPMMLINEQFPGPLIEVNEGDTIVVHVDNQAVNATSIHWHGLYQNGTNHMDGTVGVTQCPIVPGGEFTYEFTVDNQYGTYWYHAHQGVQSADGMLGPLVVHSKEEQDLQELEYATDRVVLVSDHYYDTSNALLMDYLASNKENDEPVPDSGLINGRGVQDCSLYPERHCDNSTVSYPQLNLERGVNHRLRLINVGAFAEFRVSFDEHEFAVTEVDGTVVKPAYYDRLSINPAQRYSIVVNTESQDKDSFWLRAEMYTGCFQNPDPRLNPEAKAVIKYGRFDEPLVAQMPNSVDLLEGPDLQCRDMDTSELSSLPPIEAPAKADAIFDIRSNFEIGAFRLSRGMFNGSSWRADVQNPTLHRALDGLSTANESFTQSAQSSAAAPGAFVNDAAFDISKELVIQTTGLQTIDLIISNFDDGNHPLHLHGYKFFVLGQGHGYLPADFYENLDLSNPLRRDTASVEGYGWTVIRVLADNPGVWAFHCHVSWHAEAGLLMQLVTRTDEMEKMVVPEANSALCAAPISELKKGMTPEDEIFMAMPPKPADVIAE